MTTQFLGFNVPDLIIGVPAPIFLLMTLIFSLLFIILIIMLIAYNYRIYNKKIVIFENIGGRGYQPVFRDKARLIRFGDGGEELLYLKKKKVYRTAYGKKMGKDTYWFAKGQDGYDYNIVLGDVDAKMGMLDIEPTDREMRFQNVSMRKNAEDRYGTGKFFEKYGAFIISGIFLLICAILIAYIFSKLPTIFQSLNSSLSTMKEVSASNDRVLAALDKICGGGLVPN